MVAEITRKLEYANRVAVQQADQAIRKDVVRALVELVTNANDSYQRMEDAGIVNSGYIIIEFQRKHTNSVFRVLDNAEGLTADGMDSKVGKYGEATSGFKEGRSVRGLWGRGLKDSLFGLGHGTVCSVRDGVFSRCSLTIDGGQPTYNREKDLRATNAIKKQYGFSSGSGTLVEIVVSREGIRIPQFDHLRRNLERHFELRAVMANPKRRVLLRELDGKGNVKSEVSLSYKTPIGVEVLNETVLITGHSAQAQLRVFRANDPLSTRAEEGDCADGGLLIVSKGIVLAMTLFKFDENEYAARLYGHVTCDHFHELLMADDSILTATRDGINWKHGFSKCLKEAIEKRLEPLVDEERKRVLSEQRSTMNRRLRERLDVTLNELNNIADSELGKLEGAGDGSGTSGNKPPFVPIGGFGFVPEYAYIQTGKPAALSLRVSIPDKVEVGCLISIESNSPEVVVLTPQVKIQAREDITGVGEAKVELEGRQVGAEAIITATVNTLKAEAMVRVISKRVPPAEHEPKKERGGLFREVRFDPTAEPKQRVRFVAADSSIVIATKAPTVSPYLDDHGAGSESPQGQVLLAELVTDAVCAEIARRGVISGKFLAPKGSEADAIRREEIILQNKYAHKIHECLVDPEHRRNGGGRVTRKGRLPKAEQLARAAIPG